MPACHQQSTGMSANHYIWGKLGGPVAVSSRFHHQGISTVLVLSVDLSRHPHRSIIVHRTSRYRHSGGIRQDLTCCVSRFFTGDAPFRITYNIRIPGPIGDNFRQGYLDSHPDRSPYCRSYPSITLFFLQLEEPQENCDSMEVNRSLQ